MDNSLEKKYQELVEENKALKEQIKKLQKDQKIYDSLIVKNNCYFIEKENGDMDGPFCIRCWDKRKKLTRMTIMDSPDGSKTMATCHDCTFIAYLPMFD
ncbi:FtsB/FtsL family cell division protein [Parasporobacterium paucivorans]|uniref:Uncharacterized protein n=1 Tax=Parasporobacterium paucivorans DSM 15970 TaxID=1122934 RepID=A0A1M6GIV4_9FIRM|nr:hypothetical protein [Parasporobacterium paucivorans]SHJ09883.1 hypothetical protein SAMN02745691_01338 [Parasporobacterium paucivorans DSM 15970]